MGFLGQMLKHQRWDPCLILQKSNSSNPTTQAAGSSPLPLGFLIRGSCPACSFVFDATGKKLNPEGRAKESYKCQVWAEAWDVQLGSPEVGPQKIYGEMARAMYGKSPLTSNVVT